VNPDRHHLTDKGATLSEDGRYRYRLWRRYAGCCHPETMLFVMLNPSTATATQDDPTIRRCIDFALRRDYDRIEVVNLFALRATDPSELRRGCDPIGPENDEHIGDAASGAAAIVCAWGNAGSYLSRDIAVRRLLRALAPPERILCFGTTHKGQPMHPLYLSADTQLVPWRAA